MLDLDRQLKINTLSLMEVSWGF